MFVIESDIQLRFVKRHGPSDLLPRYVPFRFRYISRMPRHSDQYVPVLGSRSEATEDTRNRTTGGSRSETAGGSVYGRARKEHSVEEENDVAFV